MDNPMFGKIGKYAVAAAVSLVFAAGLASAKFPNWGKSSEVQIIYAASFQNGTVLQPGTYKVSLAGEVGATEAVFSRNGKEVARVPAKLVDQGRKVKETQVQYTTQGQNTRVITEIGLQGWNQALVFADSAASADSGQ